MYYLPCCVGAASDVKKDRENNTKLAVAEPQAVGGLQNCPAAAVVSFGSVWTHRFTMYALIRLLVVEFLWHHYSVGEGSCSRNCDTKRYLAPAIYIL